MAVVLPSMTGVNRRFCDEGDTSSIFADCSVAGMDSWNNLHERCVELQTETGKPDGEIGNVSVNFNNEFLFPRKM
jgi:hypothetical protein